MSEKRVLVTGPTGFIGINLVKQLLETGHIVTALVRSTSDTSILQKLGVSLVEADLGDAKSLISAVADQHVIYHLAAVTRAIELSTFERVNLDGFRNLMLSAIAAGHDPKLILVSSLAAVGPSTKEVAHREDANAMPVSNYGKSKRAVELLASQYSDRLNISIIRPPIVLGPHDDKGLSMFQTISRFGIHLKPGLRDANFSVIHVSDLCAAMLAVAARGRRVTPNSVEEGTYFVAADEIVTYGALGSMISDALGKKFIFNLPIFHPVLRLMGGFNTLIGCLKGSPTFLNYDKVRDVIAGSWSCENFKLKQDTGFDFPTPLTARIAQTVKWYRNEGWLRSDRPGRSKNSPVLPTIQNGRRGSNEPTMDVN